MYRVVVLLAVVLAVCQAEGTGSQAAPIRCGVIPSAIYRCLGNPKIVKSEVSSQCSGSGSECDRLKCIFRKSGWLSGETVNRQKMASFFDEYAREHPEWSAAVAEVKSTCLAEGLQVQGVYINCPAYDIVHCAISSFFKNASPGQWSTSSECEYPRQFAAACPVCPEDCFAPAIPYGSCNACRLLPRSP